MILRLGLHAGAIAKALGIAHLLAIDSDDDNLEQASKMGADETLNSQKPDVLEHIQHRCRTSCLRCWIYLQQVDGGFGDNSTDQIKMLWCGLLA